MNLIYIVGFDTNGSSGRSKATREKSKVLKKLCGDGSFSFIAKSKNNNSSFLNKLFDNIIFDLKVSFKLLFQPMKSTVIQRIEFMPFTLIVQIFKRMIVINEFHADLKDEIPYLKKTSFEKTILYLAIPLLNIKYKLGNGIIYNHIELMRAFSSKYNVPSIYSYNGSNTKEFYPENKFEIRKKMNIKQSNIIFLFLGSVSLWHGVNYLLDIFNEDEIIAKKNLFLYIVGAEDDAYTESLKMNIQNNNILFVPPVDTDTARDFINASDYCMLPANQVRISPGSPLKLYDYISCGKTIISQSDLYGYSDEVIKYNLGYTLDFRDSIKSASAILDIIEMNNDFSVNNINMAKSDLSWESRMKSWVEFAEKLNS